MAIINLGLQSVGLSREKLSPDFESLMEKCSTMADLREMNRKQPGFDKDVMDSIAPAKIILSDITQRLELKGQQFTLGTSATDDDMIKLWKELQKIDPDFQLPHTHSLSAKSLTPRLVEVFQHCCRERHYFFEIKKCGEVSCSICRPVRAHLPSDVKLEHLPDPMPGSEGHYKPFNEVFGTATSEHHRPSLNNRGKKKTLPFSASVQHVKNIEMMLCCDECGMWRLVYSKRKLNQRERKALQTSLDGMSFSCGAELQNANIPDEFKDTVFVRKIECSEPIEKLYYSAKFADICIHCACDVPAWSDTEPYYPQCDGCEGKEHIPNAKALRQSNTVFTLACQNCSERSRTVLMDSVNTTVPFRSVLDQNG